MSGTIQGWMVLGMYLDKIPDVLWKGNGGAMVWEKVENPRALLCPIRDVSLELLHYRLYKLSQG